MKNAGASIEHFFKWKGENRHFSNREYIDHFGNEYNKYFTFSTIRNPWDRMVSMYFFGKQKEKHFVRGFDSFNKWIQYFLSGSLKEKRHWSQFDWLKDHNNEINIDFICRFETLGKDWETLCEIAGIKYKKLPFINKTIGKKKNYRKYYNNRSKELVAQTYREDIETFGYTFEGVK